ncbi:ras guanine nucleotide exchange factor domain-containing protein [Halteromyces radiatus]|uniref:ras guanine nucleotide exchange factor domain-containing protein n=1 Tax=Halteromyces radiatus TaxID=101107 RepID=UPI00221FBC82|nr:ras guanine nucleotide exchange factor domain-containing protein [Halteromyces radiatus]KAI8093459.1 ras guanine nucleotide exchange factor domain-containing protein [Halteromyces radiatus]
MLLASGTVDKDAVYLRTNAVLRAHHRTMMASLSKLILSSHACVHNPTDNISRMLSDSNDLLLATRNFVSTSESIPVPVQHIEPQLQKQRRSSTAINNMNVWTETSTGYKSKYTLDADLAESVEAYGNNMQESIDGMINSIVTYKQQLQASSKQTTIALDSPRSSLSALLFSQFRNFSNQTGQFLDIFDEIDFTEFQSPELIELGELRQKLYRGIGDLFCKLQVLTDESVPLNGTAEVSEQDGMETKKTIQDICDYNGSPVHSPTKLDKTDNSNATGLLLESLPGLTDATSSSARPSSTGALASTSSPVVTSGTSVSPTSVQDNISTSLQRKPSTSPEYPRQSSAKLKKFFGDDVPEQISHTPPSEEERPWYLQYDYKPNEIVFNMEGSVKGGTLMALVVRLTLHDYLDMNFINTFLLTYRSFCSSMELLKLLEKRYTGTPPEGLTEQELEIWRNKKLKLIRLRVFNVLKNWLEQYYNEDDHMILDELLEFTTTTIRSTLRFSAEQLERLIKKRKEATGDGLKKMVLTLPTAPPVPILPRNRKKFRLMDIDALELARQMTIMDFKLYSSIRPVECLNKAWSKDAAEDQAHVAVNIRASIEYCNQVTSWVSDAILSQSEVKKRVTLIKHWVQIAERCRQLNNFNTCMAILSAFDNSAVGRLKRTWEMVGARTNQVLSQIRRLMGANRNFTEYRAIIHSINPPCIPFLGIYLQDLTFIEDGNADYLKTSKDMINFAKRAKTAEVIREIQQYQSTYYQLTPVDEIQAFIQTNLQSTRDEEQLYNESLKLEPREREDEKITRLLQESGFL